MKASFLWREAEDAARQGLWSRAYEGLREAAPHAHDASAYARLAEVAWEAGDATRCAQAARQGLIQMPRATRLLLLLGECEAERGDLAAARDAHERGLLLLPDNSQALWGLARLGTGPTRIQLLREALEAARLEELLLPSASAWREREDVRRLSLLLEQELARAQESGPR